MLFRQLFDPETSTYTYLIADEASREAALIDPVRELVARDTQLLEELGLRLRFTLDTHVHADHVTASGLLRERLGSQVGVGSATGVENADVYLEHGTGIRLGQTWIEALATPGHTSGCTTYVWASAGMAFTGDALLIRGCGRTDFQQGDAEALFRSVRERIFALPDATLLYPGHDYRGRTVTSVAEEKRWNPRLGLSRNATEFADIMRGLKLDYPRRMEESVPANLRCGLGAITPPRATSVAQLFAEQGRQDSEAILGLGI
jgi:glyoxylase-like metal-dependent hydrolase (beta-lactamase superfamily II)